MTRRGTQRPSQRMVAGVIAAAVAAVWLAGCAPVPPPQPGRLDVPSISARYATRLAERRAAAAIAAADYSVWLRRAGASNPPGVAAHVTLASPDRFRVRVDGVFGVALEAAARGDSLVIDAPAVGLAAVSDLSDGGSARADVGGWVWRALAADWAPPAAAWAAGIPLDSAVELDWVDGGDSLTILVAATGLPRSARLRAPDGLVVEIRYDQWEAWNKLMWPVRVVANDGEQRYRVTLQAQMPSFRGRPAAALPPLRIPVRAHRVSRDKLLAWLERMAGGSPLDSTEIGEP